MVQNNNQVVAAILTAGRMPTMAGGPRPMEDWLAEYQAWLEALEKRDRQIAEASTQVYIDSLK